MGSFCLLTWFEDLQQEWSFCFKADSRFSPFLQVKLSYRLHRGNISSKVFIGNSSFISKHCLYFPVCFSLFSSLWLELLFPVRNVDIQEYTAMLLSLPIPSFGFLAAICCSSYTSFCVCWYFQPASLSCTWRYWPFLLTNCSDRDLGGQSGLCAVLLEPVA